MKIKKFNNKWTMGLIIFATILIALYLLKFISPKFVIGVAEIPEVVAFGTYVDTHWWAYYLFSFITSFFGGYFYCCACCRKKKLNKIENIILCGEIILLFLAQKFIPSFYFEINIACMLIMPTIMCKIGNTENSIKYLYSIIICFIIHSVAQILSLQIRDISLCLTRANIATFTILLIDTYIWLVLLYNYYNYKEDK